MEPWLQASGPWPARHKRACVPTFCPTDLKRGIAWNPRPTDGTAHATSRSPKASGLWLGDPRGRPPPNVSFRPACIVPVWFLLRPTHNLYEAKLAVIYHLYVYSRSVVPHAAASFEALLG